MFRRTGNLNFTKKDTFETFLFTFNCQRLFQANSYIGDVYIILVKYILNVKSK